MPFPPKESQQNVNAPNNLCCATKDHRAPTNPDGDTISKETNRSKENADGKSDDKFPGKTKKISTNATTTKPEKIKVHMVAVGSAPILKKSKFLMNADDRFAVAIAFLRKRLKLSPGAGDATASSLFLYVNAAFVPPPDERIGDLFDCFGTRGELVVHYSLQEAWG